MAGAAAAAAEPRLSRPARRRALVGEARIAAIAHVRAMLARGRYGRSRPLCIVSSGETTVHVTGGGKGGRNQEFALAAADAARQSLGGMASSPASAPTASTARPMPLARSPIRRRRARRGRRPLARPASSSTTIPARFSPHLAISHHRSDRHQRRRPPSNSVSLILNALTRFVLALMRERVHHPAAMRELLQMLKVPRDDRTDVQAPPQVTRRLRRPHPDSRAALRPARKDGPLRRPAADARRRATASSAPNGRSNRRRRHLHFRHEPQRSDARRPRRRAHRADQGRRPRRRARSSASSSAPTRRSSAATTATRTAWATSCRSIAAC